MKTEETWITYKIPKSRKIYFLSGHPYEFYTKVEEDKYGFVFTVGFRPLPETRRIK